MSVAIEHRGYHRGPFKTEEEAREACPPDERNELWHPEFHRAEARCERCGVDRSRETPKPTGWWAVARNEQGSRWSGAPWACHCDTGD